MNTLHSFAYKVYKLKAISISTCAELLSSASEKRKREAMFLVVRNEEEGVADGGEEG